MKEFYPSDDSVGDGDVAEFDTVVVYRRSCVALLEELKKMKITREMKTRVREEAMKMASDWKGKMKVADENWLEALGFLLLVTTYGLTYAFDTTELQDLLIIVAQQEQATELCRDLGILFKQAPANQESLVARNEAPAYFFFESSAHCHQYWCKAFAAVSK